MFNIRRCIDASTFQVHNTWSLKSLSSSLNRTQYLAAAAEFGVVVDGGRLTKFIIISYVQCSVCTYICISLWHIEKIPTKSLSVPAYKTQSKAAPPIFYCTMRRRIICAKVHHCVNAHHMDLYRCTIMFITKCT